MKKLNNFILFVMLLGFSSGISAQDLVCNNDSLVTLGPEGQVVLGPDYFIQGVGNGQEILISRDDIDYGPSVTLECGDMGQPISVYVKYTDDSDQCISMVSVNDNFAPSAICLDFAMAVPSEGEDFVEVYAEDLDLGSFDNCTTNFTFGDFPFNFAPEVIEGVTVDRTIDHYFDDNGPIAAAANASASVLQDYESSLIQLWHANENSSSMIYLAGAQEIVLDVDMMVTDESGLYAFCTTELKVRPIDTNIQTGVCASVTVSSTNISCGPEFIYAEDFIDPSILFELPAISYDGINFSSSLSGSDLQSGSTSVYVKYIVEDVVYGCNSLIVIEDEIGPVVVSDQEIVLQLEAGANGLSFPNAYLAPSTVDEGSYDLCGDITMSLSKSFFTTDDLGENTVLLTVVDESGNSNTGFTLVNVLGSVDFASGDCLSASYNTTPFGCGPDMIYAEDFIDPEVGFDSPMISYDGISFFPELTGDELTSGSNDIYVRYNIGTEFYECNGVLNVVDNYPPVIVLEPEVTIALFPNNAGVLTANLAASAVDDGSYDACTNITLALSQSLFTEADLGENMVTLTVTDENGNWNQGVTIVNVIDGGDCFDQIPDLILWPLDTIYITSANASPSNISHIELIDDFGFPEEDVYPTVLDFCEISAIGISYDDIVNYTTNGWVVERTFNALNWNNSSSGIFTQIIIFDDNNANSIYCLGAGTVLIDNDPIELYAIDMVVQYYGDPNNLTLVLTDMNDVVVPDNLITADYIGQTITAAVTDSTTENSCWVSVDVIGGLNSGPCSGGPGVSFSWPNAIINIYNTDAGASELQPSQLIENYGYEISEVMPVWDENCNAAFVTSYSDTYTGLSSDFVDTNFTIIRSWIVFDMNIGEFYGYIQIINAGIDLDDYICDFLDRTTPLGDCSSGHTDTDDVEWPADIAVADHRISPEELVDILGVDSLDAAPSFYNSPESYTFSYVDEVKTFSSSTLVLDRVWTVEHEELESVSWTYRQEIEIDLSSFNNLVTASTITGKAISDVIVNGDLLTDDIGSVTVEDGTVVSIQKQSDFSSGVDLRDLILIKDHILGITLLDDLAALAADLNNDYEITVEDLTLLRDELLNDSQNSIIDWKFLKKRNTDGAPLPAAAYVGVKPADVDDSYVKVVGTIIENEVEVSYDDRLLNKGESYDIEVILSKSSEVRGGRLVFDMNIDVLDVNQVNHTHNGDIEWNIDSDGKLIIISESAEGFFIIDSEDAPLFTITVTALENGVLNENLALDEVERSLFIDESYNYNVLEGEIFGVISSTLDDPNNPLSYVSVYPNPAVSIVNIEMEKVNINDVKIELINASGQIVLTQQGSSSFDVSELTSGVYVYRLTSGGYTFFNKLLVIK